MMQIMDGSYEAKADRNVIREVTVHPPRGLIFDRNNNLVVNNQAVHDLTITPLKVKGLDTLKLCELLGVTRYDFQQAILRAKSKKGYSAYKPQVLFKHLPKLSYDRLKEHLYKFPGFDTQRRTVRSYPHRSAPHVLGYIGEVNQKQIDNSEYYTMGDYIGISGIEKTYEQQLRGEKGVEYMIVDVHSRTIGNYKDGKNDREAVEGQNLKLTLDIELQNYAEELMRNKRGALVAIEPKSGEILSIVSAPTYDPNIFSQRGESILQLQRDTLKPLFNRALEAPYPPGSTFKPLMTLLALNEGYITENYYYGCYGGYRLGRLTVGCHGHASAQNVQAAIQHSCNAYFCHLFKLFIEQDTYDNVAEGLSSWQSYLNQFGLGVDLHHDLASKARKGFVPGPQLYDRMYNGKPWRASMIISLGIGQGELGVTPLQLAHMTAIIANKGYYYYPHVVRPFRESSNALYTTRHKVNIESRHFTPVIEGMYQVVEAGTGRRSRIDGIEMCGKTGTAENPHGKDHSLFIAFAPKDKPTIAVAVMIENGGYGSTYAAPIASLVIEKYINREIKGKAREGIEKKILEANLINN